jgi:hypothetical protein
VFRLVYIPHLGSDTGVLIQRLALSIGPNRICLTWKRRQNPVSESCVFFKDKQDGVLDKYKAMVNIQKRDICRISRAKFLVAPPRQCPTTQIEDRARFFGQKRDHGPWSTSVFTRFGSSTLQKHSNPECSARYLQTLYNVFGSSLSTR